MSKKPILWITDTQGGNYMKKVLPIASAFPQGTDLYATCYHEDWCGIYDGRPCNCDPDVVVVPLTYASD